MSMGNRSATVLLSVPAGTVLTGANTYYPSQTAPGNTTATAADLPVGTFSELAVDLNLSALTGTNPTVDVYLDRKGGDGVYYQIYHATQLTAAGVVSTSAGLSAPVNHSLGTLLRLRIVVAGTSPVATFSASIIGK